MKKKTGKIKRNPKSRTTGERRIQAPQKKSAKNTWTEDWFTDQDGEDDDYSWINRTDYSNYDDLFI